MNTKVNWTALAERAYQLEGRILDLKDEYVTIERELTERPWENRIHVTSKQDLIHIQALQKRLDKIEYTIPKMQQRLDKIETTLLSRW